jgi:Transposase IS4
VKERIPITFMESYLHKGHRLFVDNYYTSPTLAQFLLRNGTKLVGTVRPNRTHFPTELAAAELQKGEAKYAASSDGVLAVKFRALQDKSNKQAKVVCLLTTDHTTAVSPSGKKTKDGGAIVKQDCILHYNRCMGGVDLVD